MNHLVMAENRYYVMQGLIAKKRPIDLFSSFTHRVGGHLGTATQNSQADTLKTVGRHFRLPGHEAHRDLVMLPIEIVSPKDPFLLRARESYNIWKFQTEKRMGILDIEHGLNLDAGQQ